MSHTHVTFCGGALLLAAGLARATPFIFWASDPVLPGETVVVQGARFDAKTTVEVRGADAAAAWRRVEILQQSADNLKFALPVDLPPDVFTCRVSDGTGTGAERRLNRSEIWWVQGDAGESATPGGWLRVCGKNLNFGGVSRGELAMDGVAPVPLDTTAVDGFSLRFALPADLPPGVGRLRVANGLPSDPWTETPVVLTPAAAWPTNVFSVLESSAPDAVAAMRQTLVKYQDVRNHTAGILAALQKAKDNGGGVVYFPAGRYGVQGALAVPPRTTLRGEGEGLVVLWWGTGRFNLDGGSDLGYARPADAPASPPNLVSGREFALEDLSLYVPPDYQTVIDGQEGVRLRRVRVRIDHEWTLHTQRYDGWIARIGRNGAVEDCDIHAKGGGISPGRFCRVAGNVVRAGKTPCPLGGAREVIVEDNRFTSTHPTAYQNIAGEGRNLYYARNLHEALHVHQADYSFTFDAGTSAYLGTLAAVDGVNLTLAADPVFAPWAKEDSPRWKQAVVCILDGEGTGQYRDVTANAGRAWTIDRPFDVPPDAASVVTIVPFNGRVLVAGNRFEDANWVNAGFGTGIEVVYAGNRLHRCAQLLNYGLGTPGRVLPSWYVQYLDNDLREGQTSVETTGSQRPAAADSLPVTRCTIHRRTRIAQDNSGGIAVGGFCRDVLVEGCVLEHPLSGIRVNEPAQGVLLRANRTFAASPGNEEARPADVQSPQPTPRNSP